MDHRRADVQGLRAVAVLLVVVYHADLPLPGGFTGVDVFFVISGYVITAMLVREQARNGGRIGLGAFYLRRFKRLTPALALVVVVTLLASVLLLAPFGTQQIAAKTGAGALLLVANLVIARDTGGYFDAAAGSNPLLHTWSLSVEEQFYLLHPALLIGAAALARRWRAAGPVAVVGAVTVASFALMLAGVGRGSDVLGFYSPATRAWEFGVGALLALLARHLVVRGRAATALGAAGVVLLVASAFAVTSARPFPSLWTLLPVAATALLLVAGSSANPVSGALSRRWPVRVGDWSYSIYLWHWPFIVLARNVWPDHAWVPAAAAVVSLAPALASYRWVEQPFRTRSLGGRRRGALVVASVVLLPVVVAVGLRTGAERGWGVERVVESQRVTALARPAFTACLAQDTTGGAPADYAGCWAGKGRPGAPIVLVGDSNAAMYAEAVQAAGERLDRPVLVRTAAACPFADLQRGTEAGQDDTDRACRRSYDDTLAAILDGPPSTVVIAESASQVLLPGRTLGRTRDDLVEDPDGRRAVLAGGLDRTAERLRRSGHQVVLVLPVYWTGGTTVPVTEPLCTTLLGMVRGTCPASLPLTDLPRDQREVRSAVRAVADRVGAVPLDVLDAQCPDRSCGPTADGLPVYGDSGHFSAPFSASLGPRFAAAIGSGP